MGAVPIRSTTYRVNLGPVDVVMITRQQKEKKKNRVNGTPRPRIGSTAQFLGPTKPMLNRICQNPPLTY